MCGFVRALRPESVALLGRAGRTLGETICAARINRRSEPRRWMAMRCAPAISVRTASYRRRVGRRHGAAGAVGPGEAVRIFTGAPVPKGADCVVQQENSPRGCDAFHRGGRRIPAVNIREIAVDFKAGEQLIGAGTRLNPAPHRPARRGGHCIREGEPRAPRSPCSPRAREIVAPGEKAGPHQIYDSVTLRHSVR